MVENPRSTQSETRAAKLKKRSLCSTGSHGFKETHTVVTKRDLHTTRNRQTKTRKAKAELAAGENYRNSGKVGDTKSLQGAHWRVLHTEQLRTIQQQVHGEHEPFYWATQIESRWVEVAWWGRCGCQPERSRSGVNAKVLQEGSRTAELPPCNYSTKAEPAAVSQSVVCCMRPVFHSVTANNKHVIPEMLPCLRFICGAGIFDKIPARWCSNFRVVYWQVATMTLKQHNATYFYRSMKLEFISYCNISHPR